MRCPQPELRSHQHRAALVQQVVLDDHFVSGRVHDVSPGSSFGGQRSRPFVVFEASTARRATPILAIMAVVNGLINGCYAVPTPFNSSIAILSRPTSAGRTHFLPPRH